MTWISSNKFLQAKTVLQFIEMLIILKKKNLQKDI